MMTPITALSPMKLPEKVTQPKLPRFAGESPEKKDAVKVPFMKKMRYFLIGSLLTAGGAGVVGNTEKVEPWQVTVLENRITGNRKVVRNEDSSYFNPPYVSLYTVRQYSQEPRLSLVPVQLSLKGVNLPKVNFAITWGVDPTDSAKVKALDEKVAQGLAKEPPTETPMSPAMRHTMAVEKYVLVPAMQKATEAYFANFGSNLTNQLIDSFRSNDGIIEGYFKQALAKEGIRVDKIDIRF